MSSGRFTHTLLAATLLSFPVLIACAHPVFEIQDTFIGQSFFDCFNFSTFDDPTHGRVNYVSQEEAIQKNLSYASGSTFVMRADYKTQVLPTARGRDSIRIQSYASYSDSIIVLDLNHMPEGCSTWPAFWTLSAKGPWPQGGEIDSVNKNTRNLASLHTTPNCTMPHARFMFGESISTDCDTQSNFNQGCGVKFRKFYSYGPDFNNARGGWYVMKRTAEDGVVIWFWSRDDIMVPSAVKNHEPTLRPDATWGLPEAYFPFTSSCNPTHFDEHQIIFDLTFCGDFAGAQYSTSCCPGNCVDFVNYNPAAFAEAYWEINALRVYTPQY